MTAPLPLRAHHLWHHHPGVRSGSQLTFGERAADGMKGLFATWTALFVILVAMAAWIWTGGFGADPTPYILLNLCLSCLAALQCFILLIAARRSDQIAAELAKHDYETNATTKQLVDQLTTDLALLRAEHAHVARALGVKQTDAVGGES